MAQEVKYLFRLKPKYYHYDDYLWLYNKMEARISVLCNRWLSRGGILVLVMTVLESIPLYWMTLAKIPKGILTKIRHKCFIFL